ncbi:MAG: hypothetical protein ABDH28_03845, partial [Brevinematia bacterium]
MKSVLRLMLVVVGLILAVGAVEASRTLIVYVYTNSNLASWSSIQLYYWFPGTSTTGYVNRVSNHQRWYVFVISNIPNLTNSIGLKLRSDVNWTRQEPIKSGYDRIVKLPSHYSASNVAHIYVHSPVNWWECYAWWLPSEISLYENPTASAVTNYFGATYSGGTYYTTHFSFYAPNARKVYVAGTFNSWNATNIPMKLSLDRTIWWAAVNNTSPGQQYKFVVERHDGTLVWVPDPAARKQIHSTGNSVIVSQSYSWASWTRPTHDYYII